MNARVVLIACAFALLAARVAAAERPADFAWSLPIELDAREGLHQLELAAPVHQGVMRRDLGDIRVFNAAGESVPYAFAPVPHLAAAGSDALPLPFFPVHAERGVRMDAVDLKIQTRADGTVVGLSTRAPGAGSEKRIVGYLVDASAVEQPLAAVRVQWTPAPGGTHTRVRLEASTDLQRWSVLADAVPLIDLEFGGHRLTRDRIEFAPRKLEYLRLSWSDADAPVALSGIDAQAAILAIEPHRLWREAKGNGSEGTDGQYRYDLGGLFPVDRLRLALAQANTVARLEILARTRPADPWRPIADGIVYRLKRAGVETTSPDIAIPVSTERYWLVKVDPRGGGLGAGTPNLHAGWIAQRIVFAARGNPPFRLAFGNREAARSTYPIASLVPGYKDTEPIALPVAKLGDPASAAAAPAPPADRPDYRRWSLWGVLLAAVAVLAAMAYRLVRQLGKGESATSQPPDGEDGSHRP